MKLKLFSALKALITVAACFFGFQADGQDQSLPDNTEEFVVVKPSVVRSQPSRDAPIRSDLERLTVIQGTRTGTGWVRLLSATEGPPQNAFTSQDRNIAFENGAFRAPTAKLRSYRAKIEGFISESALGSLEEDQADIALPQESHSVPQLWPGIPDTRRVPKDVLRHPFSAVGYITYRISTPARTLFRETLPLCTGFFLHNSRTVVSAGHCVEGIMARQKALELATKQSTTIEYFMTVLAGSTRETSIPLTLNSWAFQTFRPPRSGEDSSLIEDWAIFTTNTTPPAGVTHLQLSTPGGWLQTGRQTVMTLGFAADLTFVKRHHFAGIPVHYDTCSLRLPDLSLIELRASAPHDREYWWKIEANDLKCQTSKGDSGGPMIMLNPQTRRYELLGITAWGEAVLPGPFSRPALAAFESLLDSYQTRYLDKAALVTPLHLNPGLIPSVAPLLQASSRIPGAFRRTAREGWVLDSRFLRALDKVSPGEVPREYFSSFFVPESSAHLVSLTRPGFSTIPDRGAAGRVSFASQFSYGQGSSVNRRKLFAEIMRVSRGDVGKGKQLALTIGDKLDVDAIRQSRSDVEIFRIAAREPVYTLAIRESDLQRTSQLFERAIDSISDDLASSEAKNLLFLLRSTRAMSVGPDLFILGANDGKILGIARNWINIMEEGSGENEFSGTLLPFIAARDTETLRTIRSQTVFKGIAFQAGALIRQAVEGQVGVESPPSIIGVNNVHAVEAWWAIADSRGGKGVRVLSALGDARLHLPLAEDYSMYTQVHTDRKTRLRRLSTRLKESGVTQSTKLIIYSADQYGTESAALAEMLSELGYSDTYWLRGGLVEWYSFGLPVVPKFKN